MAPFQIFIFRTRADRRFSEALCDSLREEFRRSLGPPAAEPQLLCSDDDFDLSQSVDDETQHLVEHCAGLIVILSESWLASEWRRRELEIFARRWGADAWERIVVVSMQDVDLRKLPDILRLAPRYDCSEWAGEFEHSPLKPRDPRFFELTERIAQRLQQLMKYAAAVDQGLPGKVFETVMASVALEEVTAAAPLPMPDDPELADLLRQRAEYGRAEDADDSAWSIYNFIATRSLSDPSFSQHAANLDHAPDPWNDIVKIPELSKAARDTVDVTAFAPKVAQADAQALVQIFLHLTEQLQRVQKIARGLDSKTKPRISTLQINIPRGERVDVALTCETLAIARQMKTIRWSGEPSSCQFLLNIPTAVGQESHFVHIELLVGGLPVGELIFDLNVRERCDPAERRRRPQGKSSRRYRHAFLSYASPDRVEVLRHAHLLNVLHTKFFQDLLSLQPGERWERRLYEEIDRCDLFLLFWCEHAAKSDWVIREAEYALERQKASPKGLPHIRPIILHGPRVPAPGQLAELHFNDPIASVIAGEEARRSSGR